MFIAASESSSWPITLAIETLSTFQQQMGIQTAAHMAENGIGVADFCPATFSQISLLLLPRSLGEGAELDIDHAASFDRMSALRSHPDATENDRGCLGFGKGTDQKVDRAAESNPRSAEMENPAALNSLGICLERIHKNQLLAAQYYERTAQQAHPDGTNNFGFCLEWACCQLHHIAGWACWPNSTIFSNSRPTPPYCRPITAFSERK
jgi:hypothetical protein